MQIEQTKEVEKVKELRNKRNQTLKKLSKEIQNQKEKEIDEIFNMIQKENQSVAVSKAVKQLKIPLTRGNASAYNQMGQRLINKKDQYNEIKKHFRFQFWNEKHEQISLFIGEPRPLDMPISKHEVEKAIYKRSSNNALRQDKFPMELIKYAQESAKEKNHPNILQHINEIFRRHKHWKVLCYLY